MEELEEKQTEKGERVLRESKTAISKKINSQSHDASFSDVMYFICEPGQWTRL